MGYFTEGYNKGQSLQKNELSPDDLNSDIKNLIGTAKLDECVEWYNGFYKGMLDYDIAALRYSFSAIKKETLGEKDINGK